VTAHPDKEQAAIARLGLETAKKFQTDLRVFPASFGQIEVKLYRNRLILSKNRRKLDQDAAAIVYVSDLEVTIECVRCCVIAQTILSC